MSKAFNNLRVTKIKQILFFRREEIYFSLPRKTLLTSAATEFLLAMCFSKQKSLEVSARDHPVAELLKMRDWPNAKSSTKAMLTHW